MTSKQGKYGFLVGVGGLGTGMFFSLRGNHTLGRNESRGAGVLDRRDFCKLHIVAHYVARLGGAASGGMGVFPVGKVGRDLAGEIVLEHTRRVGMDTRYVLTEPGYPTLFSVCFTYPDGDGGNITTDDSVCSHLSAADVDRALADLPTALAERGMAADSGGIALAVAEVPLSVRTRLLEAGRERGWLTAAAVNTGEVNEALSGGMFRHVDLLSLNREEAAAVAQKSAGEEIATLVRRAGERVAKANPQIRLCVTAGGGGSYGWVAGSMEHTPAPPVRPVNTAGAGDATLAALIVGTAAGLPFIDPRRPVRAALKDAPLETAMDLAALLAGLAVTSEDTINFEADADAIAKAAADMGADATAIEPALAMGRPAVAEQHDAHD